ncbi:MAG: hypothetical protein ABFE13_12050 [Phycisphaerales bacterium]
MTTGNYIELVLFAAGILLAVYGFIYRLDRRVSAVENRCDSNQVVIDTIATLSTRLDKVSNDNEVFWKVIGPHLEHIIHSPKSVKRDALVAKLTSGVITREELPVLIELLHEAIAKSEWTNEKRFAGILLLARATALFNDKTYERRRLP